MAKPWQSVNTRRTIEPKTTWKGCLVYLKKIAGQAKGAALESEIATKMVQGLSGRRENLWSWDEKQSTMYSGCCFLAH